MREEKHRAAMRIGELAGRLGLNAKTVRYYESIGLLPMPPRTAAGYRQYGDADLERLRFVLKARTLGLSLEEIRDILTLRREGVAPCRHVAALVEQKLAAVDAQLRALAEFKQDLLTLAREAKNSVPSDTCVCGLIERHRPGRQGEALPLVSAGLRRRR